MFNLHIYEQKIFGQVVVALVFVRYFSKMLTFSFVDLSDVLVLVRINFVGRSWSVYVGKTREKQFSYP